MRQVSVAIIGAGFGGIGAGITLKRKGIEDFVIFEGEPGVGGSWRTNTYPGCACDVPSHLYSYSFEPNPEWTRAFSPYDDIRKYIEHCSDKYDINPHVRLNTRVQDATFDETKGAWRVTTDDGQVTEARVLVQATGALSHPKYPDIEGMDDYEGVSVHAARWDDSVELAGKRVAVLGSGATAIQVVPSVAKQVADLKVFQRTPSWVLPKNDQVFTEAQKVRWRRSPWLQRFARLLIYWTMELALPALMWFPRLLRVGERWHKRSLEASVEDPELREKLTPKYKVGCKRTLLSDDWFAAFARDNVHLVTEGIDRITPKGIRTVDGTEHEFDVLIYATGYEIMAPAFPFEIRGVGGRTLHEYWGEQPRAFFGLTVPSFPNLMLIMGPNTAPGHTSVLIYQEAQYDYIANYTDRLLKGGELYFDVKEDVVARHWQGLQNRMRNSSWLSGCQSWYLNPDGSNSTMWPGFSWEYILRVKNNLHLHAYDAVRPEDVRPRPEPAGDQAAATA